MTKENPMRNIRIEKVTLNIGLGKESHTIDNAYALLERMTGKKPVKTLATKKARTFKIGGKRPIGVKVTLRGKEKTEVLKKTLVAVENCLKRTSFDNEGNFGFGVPEYLEIPGEKYDPKIGILGLNVCVTLARPGARVKKRKIRPQKLARSHRISQDEAIGFAEKELGVKVI